MNNTTVNVDYVLIKNKEQTKLRIKLTPPANSKIIGYVTNPNNYIGAYNFGHGEIGTNVSGVINVDEDISEISRDNAFTRNYYAVDVVGNISTQPITVKYTFDNPHVAKDIELIKNPLTSDRIPDDVRTAMNNDGLKFANFEDIPGVVQDKTGITWFSDGYIVIRCTLNQKADDSDNTGYYEKPTKVTLHDVYLNGWYNPPRKESPERGASGTGNSFKVYSHTVDSSIEGDSDKDSSGRYYCWIAFKLSSFSNNDDKTDYGGSKINAVVHGKDSKSELTLLNTGDAKDYGWKQDTTYPTIKSDYIKDYNSEKILYKYYWTEGKAKEIVYDNKDSTSEYKSVSYERGMNIYIPKADITDTITGLSSYRFDYSGNTSDTWNTMEVITSGGTDYYQFKLPEIETVHTQLNLWIRDIAGNISNYPLAYSDSDNNAFRYRWWIVNNLFTKKTNNEGELVDAAAPTMTYADFTSDATDYTFNVTVPAGSIIKSIVAKVDGVPVTDAVVTFNEYKTNSTTLNGTQGYLNISGLKVKLNKITQKWNAQSVQIIINGDESKALTAANFVPVKTLTEGDINLKLSDDTALPETVDAGTYTIKIEAPVTITSVSNETTNPDGMTVGWNSQSPTVVTLNNVPQSWEKKDIYIKINNVSKKVFSVKRREIAAGDIKVTPDSEFDAGNSSYTFTIGTETSAPLDRIKYIEVVNETGTIADGWEYNSEDNTISVTFTPVAQKLIPQSVKLKFKDDINREIEKDNVFTIKARDLIGTDFTVNHTEENGVHTVTITINDANVENNLISDSDIEVINASIDGEISRNANTLSFTLKDIVAAGWNTQTVTVKVKEFTPVELFTVAAKTFTADNIKVEVGTATGNAYPLTITTTDGAPITKIELIEPSDGTIADWTHDTENNKIETTLTVEPGYSTKSVNLIFNKTEGGEGLVKSGVVQVEAKALDSSDFIITAGNDTPTYSSNSSYLTIKILAEAGTITSVESGSENITLDWTPTNEQGTSNVWQSGDYNITGTTLTITQIDTAYDAIIKVNGISITLFEVPAKESTGGSQSGSTGTGSDEGDENTTTPPEQGSGDSNDPGAANKVGRSIFGMRTKGNSYSSTNANSTGDAPKTRSVSLTSWVTNLFNNDSEVAAETVKDEVKSTTAKAAKKAKKAQKAAAAKVEKAPVEKPVVTETVETVAVTSAAVVSEVVETVTETVVNCGTIATVEEAAPEAKVSMTAVDASVTESVADDQAQSGAILWLALAALCAAVAGVVVLILKNRTAKK